MKGRQKLCRRLSRIFFNREIFTGCVLCEISDQRGGKKFAFVFVKSMQQPWQKKNEGGRSGKRFLALCRTDGPRSLPFTLSCELATIFQPSLSPSLPFSSLSLRPSFFLLSARKGKTEEKRKEQMQYEVPGVN